MANGVTGKILETYAVLEATDKTKLIYASISWNGRPPKDEIRNVWIDEDGEEHLGKGVAITDSNMRKLIAAYERKEQIPGGLPEKPDDGTVNFSKIFDEADSIADIRAKGYATKDGLARLTYREGVNPRNLEDNYKKMLIAKCKRFKESKEQEE